MHNKTAQTKQRSIGKVLTKRIDKGECSLLYSSKAASLCTRFV